jgi:hypothetical protein
LDLEASKGMNMFEVEDLGLFAPPSEKSVNAMARFFRPFD